MGMNFEKIDNTIGQSVSAASKTSSTVKTEQTQNTVFEGQEKKKSSQLTEKEIKYLKDNGYDITKMTSMEIQKALEPLFEDMESTKPNESKENGLSESKSENKLNSEAKNTKVNINYNDDLLCQMGFDPSEVGIEACDFYSKLSEKEQQEFFVKNLAKNQYGSEWENLSEQQQLDLMASVESELSEKIPSWKNMTSQDRVKLGLAFLAASEESSSVRYYGDENVESLDVQIENTIKNIITQRNNDEEILKENFNKEIQSRYGEDTENIAGKQLEYLQQKVDKNGIENLNAYEKSMYDTLTAQKETSGDENLSYIELNKNEENSFFYKMKNSDEFKSYVEKRKLEIYNSMSCSMEDAEKAAQAEFAKQSFIDQFADCKNKEERVKKYQELQNSCTTVLERENLNKLKNYVLKGHTANLEDAGYEAVNLSKTGDVEGQKEYGKNIAEAVKDGRITSEEAGNIPTVVKKRFANEAVSQATADVIAVSPEAAEKFCELQKTEGYTKAQQKEIHAKVLENEECDKKSKNIMAENIGLMDDDIEMEIHEDYTKKAVKDKDAELMNAVAKGTASYSKENQVQVTKSVMQASENFDKDDAIQIQNTLADQISKADKDNQLAMHKEVMASEYSEVQERAAANIKDYDNSVKSQAIDVVYDSGNSKAVKAVVDNLEKMPPDIQKTEVSRLVGEIVLNGAISNGNFDTPLMGGTLTANDLSKMTASQRKEYFMKQFQDAPPAKKLEILMKMSSSVSGIHQRTIYTVIARFSPSLLKGMVERGMGKSMLEAGLPVDAVNKIISVMKTSTNNEVITQLKELKQDRSFEKYFADEDNTQSKNNTMMTNTLKNTFAASIDPQAYKKLKDNNATMYIKS